MSALPAAKYLLGSMVIFLGGVALLVAYSHGRIVATGGTGQAPKPLTSILQPLPVISEACAGKLNSGGWGPIEGLPADAAKVCVRGGGDRRAGRRAIGRALGWVVAPARRVWLVTGCGCSPGWGLVAVAEVYRLVAWLLLTPVSLCSCCVGGGCRLQLTCCKLA